MKIVILTRKRLNYNSRIKNITSYFKKNNYKVVVFSIDDEEYILDKDVEHYKVTQFSTKLKKSVLNIHKKSMNIVIYGRNKLSKLFDKKCRLKKGEQSSTRNPFHLIIFSLVYVASKLVKKLATITIDLFNSILNIIIRRLFRTLVNLITRYSFVVDYFGYLYQVNKKCSYMKVEYVIAHDTITIVSGFLLSKKLGCEFIWDAIEYPYNRTVKNYNFFTKAIEKYIIKKAEMNVVTVSKLISEDLKKYYKIKNILVLRNSKNYIPLNELKQYNMSDQKVEQYFNENKVLLYVGAITRDRGLETILDVIDNLPNEFKCILIGPQYGDTVDILNDKYKQLSSRFLILDPIDVNEVVYFASKAYIGIIPLVNSCLNHYYACPNKLFEYIMARIPIIASDFPELRMIINEWGIGKLYSPEHTDELKQKIIEIDKYYTTYKHNLEIAAIKNCWEKEVQKINKLIFIPKSDVV